LPRPFVCEAFGNYENALRHFEAYQLTEADWGLYHDLRKVPWKEVAYMKVLRHLTYILALCTIHAAKFVAALTVTCPSDSVWLLTRR